MDCLDGLKKKNLVVGARVLWAERKVLFHLATVVSLQSDAKAPSWRRAWKVRLRYKHVDGRGGISFPTTPWVPADHVVALPIQDDERDDERDDKRDDKGDDAGRFARDDSAVRYKIQAPSANNVDAAFAAPIAEPSAARPVAEAEPHSRKRLRNNK
jgi:hypothetical protein